MSENAEDKIINCADCHTDFVHSAASQKFYADQGFSHQPKRCPSCRSRRKQQRDRDERVR